MNERLVTMDIGFGAQNYVVDLDELSVTNVAGFTWQYESLRPHVQLQLIAMQSSAAKENNERKD